MGPILKSFARKVLMMRPAHFGYNPETAVNNAFQQQVAEAESAIQEKAIQEFDAMVELLRSKLITVNVIQDSDTPIKPDAVFPNNWISFHTGGMIMTYPMFAPLRRLERDETLIARIEQEFGYTKRYSFEIFEDENIFLEGTGSMIFDRDHNMIFACVSPRTDALIIDKVALLLNYDSCIFDAHDKNGQAIYHTNVLMALGTDFVVCCMDAVPEKHKSELLKAFEMCEKRLINISFEQMESFAGNMLQVYNSIGDPYLLMSQTAYNSLTPEQIADIKQSTEILSIAIPTIETVGGGSVRCMVAELF